jgi:hypothetical protein
MRERLTPRERLVLRRLGEQLWEEDPGLAARLHRPGTPALVRYSPLRWPAPAYLVLAVVWLVLGIALEVDSAIAASMGCLVAAAARGIIGQESVHDLSDSDLADPPRPPG